MKFNLSKELKTKVIGSLKENKLTIREAAEILDIEYWEMQQIIEEEGIEIIDVSEDEIKKKTK